jgi:hypothetical protein
MSKKGERYAKILAQHHVARFGITKSAGTMETLQKAYRPAGEATAHATKTLRRQLKALEEKSAKIREHTRAILEELAGQPGLEPFWFEEWHMERHPERLASDIAGGYDLLKDAN